MDGLGSLGPSMMASSYSVVKASFAKVILKFFSPHIFAFNQPLDFVSTSALFRFCLQNHDSSSYLETLKSLDLSPHHLCLLVRPSVAIVSRK